MDFPDYMISKSSFSVSYKQVFCSSLDKPRISLGEGSPEEIHLLPSGPRLSCWPQQSQGQRGKAVLCCTQLVNFVFLLGGSCHSLLSFLAPSQLVFQAAMCMLYRKKGQHPNQALSLCNVPQITLIFQHLLMMLEHLDYVCYYFWVKFLKCSYFTLSTSTYICIYFDRDFSLMEKVKCL